jgi:heat shock protein HtpX
MPVVPSPSLSTILGYNSTHSVKGDDLISSVAATIGGAISMIADMAIWAALFGGFGGSDEEEGGGNLVGGIVMIIVAPIAVLIIQLAISRSREFGADAGGAKILGNPLPLASALEKLEAWSHSRFAQPMPVRPATAHLYIVPPIAGGLASLFRTHPVTTERVRRLREMAAAPSFKVSQVSI